MKKFYTIKINDQILCMTFDKEFVDDFITWPDVKNLKLQIITQEVDEEFEKNFWGENYNEEEINKKIESSS